MLLNDYLLMAGIYLKLDNLSNNHRTYVCGIILYLFPLILIFLVAYA